MAGAHGLCPACRSRVLPAWQVCKFCGEELVEEAEESPEAVVPAGEAPADAAASPAGALYDPLPPLPGLPPPPGSAPAAAGFNPLPPIPGVDDAPAFQPFGALGSATEAAPEEPRSSFDFSAYTSAQPSDWDAPAAPPAPSWMPAGTGEVISGELPPGPPPEPPVGQTGLPEVWHDDDGAPAPPPPEGAPAPPPPEGAAPPPLPPPPDLQSDASSAAAETGDNSWAQSATWVTPPPAPETDSEADAAAAASAGYVWDNPVFTEPAPSLADDEGAFAFADSQTATSYEPPSYAAPGTDPAAHEPEPDRGYGADQPAKPAARPGTSLFGGAPSAPPDEADGGAPFGAAPADAFAEDLVQGAPGGYDDAAFGQGYGFDSGPTSQPGSSFDQHPPQFEAAPTRGAAGEQAFSAGRAFSEDPHAQWDKAWEASPWAEGPGRPSALRGAAATPGGELGPVAPPQAEAKVSREVRLLAMAILIVLALTTALFYYRKGGESGPAVWDPRVAAVAAFVEKDSGQRFRNPVAVHFLSSSAFDQELADDHDVDGKARTLRVADTVATLRALGLMTGEVDAAAAARALDGPAPVAFYSFRRRALYLDGTQVTVGTRVALSYALAEAMQAQLDGYRASDPAVLGAAPLDAVAAGTAKRVQDHYIAGLSTADAAAYEQQPAWSTSTDSVPAVLTTLGALRKAFGERWVRVVQATQGSSAVQQALEIPPNSDQEVFDPFVYVAANRPLQVEAPGVPTGADRIASGEFGTTLLYLTLADRIAAFESLDAADAWSGDAFTSYRTHTGTVCIDVNFRASSDAGTAAIQVALNHWAASLPNGQAAVSPSGLELRLHACDPGSGTTLSGGDRSATVIRVPLVRTEIAAGLYENGKQTPNGPNGPIFTADQARCVGDTVLHELTLEEIAANNPAGSAKVKRLASEALPRCTAPDRGTSGTP